MLRPETGHLPLTLLVLTALFAPKCAFGAVENSLILNEANTVSGSNFIKENGADSTFGHVQGNGQNWLEFLVVQGDSILNEAEEVVGYKNTLDLRGWKFDWKYDKDHGNALKGNGAIEFSDDPLWAAVPRGTMITISEWSDVWYKASDLTRSGGYDGLGNLAQNHPKGPDDFYIGNSPLTTSAPSKRLLETNTSWSPGANGGGANGDWNIQLFAGDTPSGPIGEFKYFTFTGSVTKTSGTYAIGTDNGGLFVANNDFWQFSIYDTTLDENNELHKIQGPIGEEFGGFGLGADEILKLEGLDETTSPTQSQYLGVDIDDYNDGTSSTFGSPNLWDNSTFHQGLSGLRDWLHMGDADLDGAVTAADYAIWRMHFDSSGDWRDGDFSGNGTVDMADLGIWRAHFGEGVAPGFGSALVGGALPEPHSCLLLTMASILLFVNRKRPVS